jgi:hypothetical protein
MYQRLGHADAIGNRLHGGSKSLLGEQFERRFQNFLRSLVTSSVDAALRDARRQSPPLNSYFSDQTSLMRAGRMAHVRRI